MWEEPGAVTFPAFAHRGALQIWVALPLQTSMTYSTLNEVHQLWADQCIPGAQYCTIVLQRDLDVSITFSELAYAVLVAMHRAQPHLCG